MSGGWIRLNDGFLPFTVSNTVGSCSSFYDAPTIRSVCAGNPDKEGQ